MNSRDEIISDIRSLLDRLEEPVELDDATMFLQNCDALELPSLIASIVDYLQPALFPYEAVIYWYLFRKSILASGQQHVRVSVREMTSGVVTPTGRGGKSDNLSYSSVQTALQGLEEKKAILKSGDTNREGTLYKVCLPEEIPLAVERLRVATAQPVEKIDEHKELDFYNVSENREKVFERDSYSCHYCGKQLTRFTATLDHIQPVSKGGDNSFDNLTTACLHCNSRRGNKPVMDAIVRSSENAG